MFFPSLVAFMSSKKIIVLVLAKPNAISEWRELIGPTDTRKAKVLTMNTILGCCDWVFYQEEDPECLRARYGHDGTKNALHGSDSLVSADREIKYMFPDSESLF